MPGSGRAEAAPARPGSAALTKPAGCPASAIETALRRMRIACRSDPALYAAAKRITVLASPANGTGFPSAGQGAAGSQVMTTAQGAAALGVTPDAVRHAARRGTLTAVRHGRQWLITPDSIENYRERQRGEH